MLTPEAQALFDRIVFKKRHTDDCQQKNGLTQWQQLSDSRKRCSCAYWSCGVHSRTGDFKGFKRFTTGEVSLERAREVVKLRLETGNRAAVLPDEGKPINEAIEDFMQFTRDGAAKSSTLRKYQTLMDQLQAYADWKGLRHAQELNQDAVLEFRKAWEDEDAGYKRGRERKPGVPLWRKQSVATCRRNLKVLRLLFKRCIERKWIKDDPCTVVRFPKERTSKRKEEVKYLTPVEFSAVLEKIGGFTRQMPGYNKLRLRALILTMRWTGLRISDAVVLKAEDINGDVLHKVTKKASTRVQIPLHPELAVVLAQLTPYDGGYLFWNRRTQDSKASTVQQNFGKQIAEVFRDAGVSADVRHVSHMLRNTFAVHLIEKGLPLETVSLMLVS